MRRPEEAVRFPGTGVKSSCELQLSGLETEPRSFGRVASVLSPLQWLLFIYLFLTLRPWEHLIAKGDTR